MTHIISSNTAITSDSNFRVDTVTGEAYISQRKAAELLGVPNTSLQYYIENHRAVFSDTFQGLNSEMFANTVQYYALDARSPTDQAKSLLKQITSAGVKAYLYTMAGYKFSATKPEIDFSNAPKSAQLEEAVAVFNAYSKFLDIIKIEGNKKYISANNATVKAVSINLLEETGNTHLLSVEQEVEFTPTQMGKEFGLSAKSINTLLEEIGLQRKVGNVWEPTCDKSLYVIMDTGKKHGNGTPVVQLKWRSSAMDMIREKLKSSSSK